MIDLWIITILLLSLKSIKKYLNLIIRYTAVLFNKERIYRLDKKLAGIRENFTVHYLKRYFICLPTKRILKMLPKESKGKQKTLLPAALVIWYIKFHSQRSFKIPLWCSFFLLHLLRWKQFSAFPFLLFFYAHSVYMRCVYCLKKGLFNNSTHILSKCLFSLHSKQHKPHIIYPNNKTLTIGAFLAHRPPAAFTFLPHWTLSNVRCMKRELAHQQ